MYNHSGYTSIHNVHFIYIYTYIITNTIYQATVTKIDSGQKTQTQVWCKVEKQHWAEQPCLGAKGLEH